MEKMNCNRCNECINFKNANSDKAQNKQAVNPVARMTAEDKIKALQNAGIDTTGMFSMTSGTGQEFVGCINGNGKVVVLMDDDPIFKSIKDNGHINNPKLFRRWIMSQMFHMLATGDFTKALNAKGYYYQWSMLLNELKAQSKMEKHGDWENLKQRRMFFNDKIVMEICKDYIYKLQNHLDKLPSKGGKKSMCLKFHDNHMLREDLQTKYVKPLIDIMISMADMSTATNLFNAASYFYSLIRKTWMRWDIPMSKEFKSAYKGAGAYFTLRNITLFHPDIIVKPNMSVQQTLIWLDQEAKECAVYGDGWRMLAILKDILAYNRVDLKAKINSWRK